MLKLQYAACRNAAIQIKIMPVQKIPLRLYLSTRIKFKKGMIAKLLLRKLRHKSALSAGIISPEIFTFFLPLISQIFSQKTQTKKIKKVMIAKLLLRNLRLKSALSAGNIAPEVFTLFLPLIPQKFLQKTETIKFKKEWYLNYLCASCALNLRYLRE